MRESVAEERQDTRQAITGTDYRVRPQDLESWEEVVSINFRYPLK